MVDRYNPDELLICPYDPVHMIARKRFQGHLIKCRKNYNTKDFVVCPFNAKHVVTKPELTYHISICEDRCRVEFDIFHNSHNGKGDTSVPVPNWVPPSTDLEDTWDDDNVKYVPKQSEDRLFERQDIKPDTTKPPVTSTPVIRPAPVVRRPEMPVNGTATIYGYSVSVGGRGKQTINNGHVPSFGRDRGTVPTIYGYSVSVGGRGKQTINNGHVPSFGRDRGTVPTIYGYSVSVGGRGKQTINNGHVPSFGRGRGTVPKSVCGVGRGNGFVTVEKPPSHFNPEEELKILRKNVRKLNKMLKQITEIEKKREEGVVIQKEQMAKLSRKRDVLESLAVNQRELNNLELKYSEE